VSFLIELGVTTKKFDAMRAKDNAGDTALHAACLCGKLQCVELLLYYLRDTTNNRGLKPSQLAKNAGFHQVAELVQYAENQYQLNETPEKIFGCSFESLLEILRYSGSRWTKLYDANNDAIYYYDNATSSSQWERPPTYDEDYQGEKKTDQARELLIKFYKQYNAKKLVELNDILVAYKDNYVELFISLANKYEVEDLSMFAGIHFD
jgi:ankyrin repeat protein